MTWWDQWFARKSLETLHAEMEDERRLRRVLGPVALTALGVGAVIGAGIFVMTGRAAREDAGPAIIISYCVAGLGCSLAALCYAEFAALAPVAGSAYTYAYATLGEGFAWIIGWDLILEYAMGCATVASGWSAHFDELLQATFGWTVPTVIATDPFTMTGACINLPAVLVMVAVTAVLVLGIRESVTVNTALVLLKVGVVIFVVIVGWAYIDRQNWFGVPVDARELPADPAQKWGLLGLFGLNDRLVGLDDSVRSAFAPYGLSGVMLGASIVFFSYIGFDSISTHSEEARRPQRDVPIAILASLAICTVLYVGVAAVLTGLTPYPRINAQAAVATAFADLAAREHSPALEVAAVVIAVGALAGITSVLLVSFLSQARIFLAMARDGLLPPSVFGAVHPRFRTPHRATVLTGALVCVLAAFTPMGQLQNLVNIGTLMAFVMVCAAVLVLRVRRPDAARPFRCPAVGVVAPLGIAVNLTMMLFLPWETWLRLVVWLIVGLVIYLLYGRRHSRIGRPVLAPLLRRTDMIRTIGLAVMCLARLPAARAAGDEFEQLKRQFDYDAKEPLDTKATLLYERDGAKVYDVTYASPKGGRVTAYLVTPLVAGRHAGIVFGHWGPGDRTEFLPEAKLYAAAGAVSLLVDYPWVRPAPWRTKLKFLEDPETDHRAFVQAVIDLRRGLDLLAARSDVDPQWLAYVGHSYGAQWGAILSAVDTRLKGAVLVGGVPDAAAIYRDHNDPDLVDLRARTPKEKFDAFLKVYDRTSAVRYVPHAAAPLLFQFATHERLFDRAAMERYQAAATGPKTVKWYDAGHDLNDPQALIDRAEWLRERIGLRSVAELLAKRFRKE
jgi:APA family basic amino acid/polyamine antiporter